MTYNLKWYGALDVVIKWNGHIHTNSYFKVTRGTRQGSIISPVLLNIFICDLLKQLNAHESGVRVGGKLLTLSHMQTTYLYLVPQFQIYKN